MTLWNGSLASSLKNAHRLKEQWISTGRILPFVKRNALIVSLGTLQTLSWKTNALGITRIVGVVGLMVLERKRRRVFASSGREMESAPMEMPVLGLAIILPRTRALSLVADVENHRIETKKRKNIKIEDLAETPPKVLEVPIGLVVVVGVRKVVAPRSDLSLLRIKGVALLLRIGEVVHLHLKVPKAEKDLGERVPQVSQMLNLVCDMLGQVATIRIASFGIRPHVGTGGRIGVKEEMHVFFPIVS